jgi:signal transduction histidine kinase/CheY-like chemotaxis protein/streptogramin lyase
MLPGQRYSFKQYGHDEGLTNQDVECLMQDRTGFLWVGTDGGLFRYDGHQFRLYTTAQGLPAVPVYAIHQTKDGVIWAGTSDGLARLNGELFQRVAIDVRNALGLTSDANDNLYVGSALGLWVGRPASDPMHRSFRLYEVEGARNVQGIAVDSAGTAWYGCGTGICTLQNGRAAPVSGMGLPDAKWEGLLFDRQGNLWVRSARLLFELPRGGKKFVLRSEGLPFATRIASVAMDRDGEIYAPTCQGLAHRTSHGWSLIRRAHGLPSSVVDACLEDREGSFWIALDGAGLVRWQGYKQWEMFTESEGLNHDAVWAITRDTKGTLWAATQGGVSRLAPRAPRWESPANPLMGKTPHLALAADRDGTFWIGQAPGGVVHLNPLTGHAVRYDKASGLTSDWIYSLAVDPSGAVWAGTSRGIYRGSSSSSGFRFSQWLLPLPNQPKRIGTMLTDSRGRVWAATSTGLWCLSDGQWRAFGTRDGLLRDIVEYVAEAPDHSIWVAYRDVSLLSRLQLSNHGAAVNHVESPVGRRAKPYLLRFDNRGWLWLGTDTGLNRFDGTSWAHYDRGDGMPTGDCDHNAFFEDTDGSIWVGTSRGLSHLMYPEAAGPKVPEIRPVLTCLRLGGKAAPVDGPVSVPYARRSLDIAFAALSFLNEDSLHFRHRVLGLDEHWTETRQREAHYPGLGPGRYRLQVQAGPDAGIWSPGVVEVPFTVEAPWWRRWWSYLALALSLLVLVRRIWRWRVDAILGRQKELERAVADRTQKLAQEHDLALREKARAESEKSKVEQQKVEIERLLWESRQAERVKGEFVTNISHEVRTPLNTIAAVTDLILEFPLSHDQAEYLRMVKSSSASLLALMNNVLDFSNVEGGKVSLDRSEFDFATLMREAMRPFESRAREKGLQLRTRISPNFPPRLIGDAARLRQVLTNLVENALKFTETGFVEVIVRAQAITKDYAVMHGQVRDTGVGISRDQQAMIFEPFRQGDGSSSRCYGGTGLGLAMCSRLLALMDGRIWVESEPGVGSTFQFTARLGTLPCAASSNEVRPEISIPGSGLHILLVEDNIINQKLARRLLENGGHTVKCAADGGQALEACEQNQFDAILMDIQMPVMDGFEATVELRRRESHLGRRTPVIALTANAMQGDRERCLTAGMDGYVTKPINTAELLEVIAKTVGTPAR